MNERERYIEVLAGIGARWSDPDHPARAAAVEQTLAAENRFTEQAVAFAVNQQTAELTGAKMRAWYEPYPFRTDGCTVTVLNAGNVPFTELQDFVAVVLAGHSYLGVVSSRSPRLFPAFVEEVKQALPRFPAEFSTFEEALKVSRAVIASGSDETVAEIAARCESAAIPAERRLLRGSGFAVAVLSGRESDEERSGLAEDVLLHEGAGCRSVALVWAPRDLGPDPYFDALAQFREVFPAHPSVEGTLVMPRALLAAADRPHAYGEGFLVSKGDPEPQAPGHIRWAEYDSLDQVRAWVAENRRALQGVVTSEEISDELKTDLPRWAFGEAQRPPLSWRPDGIDTPAFLSRL